MTRLKKSSTISAQSAEILKNCGRINVASVVFRVINSSSINIVISNSKEEEYGYASVKIMVTND